MASLSSPTLLSPTTSSFAQRRPIAASAAPGRPPAGGGRRPWWAPLFRTILLPDPEAESTGSEGKEEEPAARRPGRLTAEKARTLRREMRATETWHDAMYHSAIASRLASPDDEE